ncbi:spore coat protein [Peribacillus sp. SCS-155]|uniref:spore coat protein n=1 Tax=Peribacillus sedimenti TaxID=3115297 RepID=UPI0039058A1C
MDNQEQLHSNMETGHVPQHLNHSAHEMLDVREVLLNSVNTMNQYTMLRQYVKDQELLDIMDRQNRFMQEEYNITLDCLKSGQDPYKPTQSYKMKESNDVIYGLKDTEPVTPIQSQSDISDQTVSSCILGSLKAGAAMKTMASLESSNPVVRRVLADSLPNCIEMAYEVSLYQNKRHYYQMPQFPENDMRKLANEFAPVKGQSLQ